MTDDKGNVTHYGYDDVNRSTAETFGYGSTNPPAQTKSYTYGSQYGELTTMTDPNGNVVDHDYDNALRLTTKNISMAGGSSGVTKEEFVFDGLNRMTKSKTYIGANFTPGAETNMYYDSLGNMWKESLKNDSNGAERATQSLYDTMS